MPKTKLQDPYWGIKDYPLKEHRMTPGHIIVILSALAILVLLTVCLIKGW